MFQRLIRVAAALLMVAALLATGCIFSPDRKPPSKPKPIDYEDPISPQNVLLNLIEAYTNRDSVGTAAVYDASYQGTSSDPGAPQPIVQFSKDDEVRHVGRLKLDPNIVSVFLDLGSAPTWQRLDGSVSDPPGWAVIPIPASRIEITDNSINTKYEAVNHIIEYTFKPTVGAPGDTTWTVVRWTEFAN
jgi:hypothetical protein